MWSSHVVTPLAIEIKGCAFYMSDDSLSLAKQLTTAAGKKHS